MATAMSASLGLVASIIIRMPTAVTTCVTICVRFWLKALLTVSTSLVMVLRISPWVWVS